MRQISDCSIWNELVPFETLSPGRRDGSNRNELVLFGSLGARGADGSTWNELVPFGTLRVERAVEGDFTQHPRRHGRVQTSIPKPEPADACPPPPPPQCRPRRGVA